MNMKIQVRHETWRLTMKGIIYSRKFSETEWKNMRDEDKLEAMERKLKVIEKFIIHDVANKIALNERKTHFSFIYE